MSEWVSEWVSQWVSESVTQWLTGLVLERLSPLKIYSEPQRLKTHITYLKSIMCPFFSKAIWTIREDKLFILLNTSTFIQTWGWCWLVNYLLHFRITKKTFCLFVLPLKSNESPSLPHARNDCLKPGATNVLWQWLIITVIRKGKNKIK